MPNAARDKGHKSERDVAKYFRDCGVPTAERRDRTGWNAGSDRMRADLGDIEGVPGISIQVKNHTGTGPLSGKVLDRIMTETITQAEASGALVPLLIEKRSGHASPGEWWVWLPSSVYVMLVIGSIPSADAVRSSYPIRMELQHVMGRLIEVSNVCGSLTYSSSHKNGVTA